MVIKLTSLKLTVVACAIKCFKFGMNYKCTPWSVLVFLCTELLMDVLFSIKVDFNANFGNTNYI